MWIVIAVALPLWPRLSLLHLPVRNKLSSDRTNDFVCTASLCLLSKHTHSIGFDLFAAMPFDSYLVCKYGPTWLAYVWFQFLVLLLHLKHPRLLDTIFWFNPFAHSSQYWPYSRRILELCHNNVASTRALYADLWVIIFIVNVFIWHAVLILVLCLCYALECARVVAICLPIDTCIEPGLMTCEAITRRCEYMTSVSN